MILRSTCLGLCLLALAAPTLAHDAPLPQPRPMDQMRGVCADFALDVGRESAAWAAGSVVQTEAGTDAASAPGFAAGELARLSLHPQASVNFALPPEQDRGGDDRFAGHARIAIPAAGLWRVSASNGLWYDAVVDGAIVHSAAFEMQTQCATPFKVVVFDLPAGELSLQFNGSHSPSVEVLALPWAER